MKYLKNINWNHLYYFYEVARFQSIKKVSAYTQHSPSTISEQIKKLETNLTVRLFERTNQGLMLTPKGEELFKHAKVIFEEGYKVLERFSQEDLGGYAVEVGIDQALAPSIAAEFITAYWDQYASFGVVNTLEQADQDVLFQNILNEKLDWGLSAFPSKRKSLVSRSIGKYKFSFCCSQHIYSQFKKKKDILYYLPYIEMTSDHLINTKINTYLRSSGVALNEICTTSHYEYMLSLLSRGRAVGLLPERVIKKKKDLKAFNIEKPLEVEVFATWKKAQEKMLSITTLKDMVESGSFIPHSSKNLQIKVSEVPKDKLTNA